MARAALDLSLTRHTFGKLKRAWMSIEGETSKEDKALFELEEGSILNYPDKMVFLAKEMKMKSHNEKTQYLN